MAVLGEGGVVRRWVTVSPLLSQLVTHMADSAPWTPRLGKQNSVFSKFVSGVS